MNIGDKFDVNKKFVGVIEVIGIYPEGQGVMKEPNYELSINGYKTILPKSLIEVIFKPVKEVIHG